MKATAHVLLASQSPTVTIEHKGKLLPFSISVFGRQSFSMEYDVFQHINQYWDSLPEIQQDKVFQIYEEIQFGFDNLTSKDQLFEYLTAKVTELIDIHNLDQIQTWIQLKSDLVIPSSFETEFVESIDNNTSREKTYTRFDYLRLTALSVLLRCMVPIWGEYISNTRQETGTQFKEYYAFQLLNKSNIVHCIPMDKLRTYIENIADKGKSDSNITLSGIASEDFGYWLLALVCIRRLCIGDIRGLDPKQHLITFIYKFIIQKIRNNDGNVDNIVKEKKFDDRGNGEESKISTLERYKVKGNLSLGEIVELEYSIRNLEDVTQKLCFNIDVNLLQRSIATSEELNQQKLLDPQMILLRWVFKPVISPKGMMYLPKPVIVRTLGVLEAVLWSRGHKYLAILSTSYAVSLEKQMSVNNQESKTRVPVELTEELNRIYPFVRTNNNKKIQQKEINLAAKSIDIIADNIASNCWKPTASEDMLVEVFGNSNRRFPIRPDLKTELTKLVIEIGSRTW